MHGSAVNSGQNKDYLESEFLTLLPACPHFNSTPSPSPSVDVFVFGCGQGEKKQKNKTDLKL